jgi:hypothetical protein
MAGKVRPEGLQPPSLHLAQKDGIWLAQGIPSPSPLLHTHSNDASDKMLAGITSLSERKIEKCIKLWAPFPAPVVVELNAVLV